MRSMRYLWVFLAAIFCTQVAFAANQPPMVMLEKTTSQLLSKLKQHHRMIQHDQAMVYRIVKHVLLPHVDLAGMSRSVLGRRAWMKASKAQRLQFMKEFTHLVVRTYAAALSSYSDQRIKYFPLRGGASSGRVQVKSLIIQQGGPSIQVNYRLIKRKQEWLVYDLIIEGVSLVQSYRAQFRTVLAQGGMSGLIARMKRMKRGG